MSQLQTQHEEGHEEHIVSPVIYIVIAATLLICTGLTVAASYLELGPWNIVVALGIAIFKATLVVLFFMHIKYSSKLMKLTVASGLFMFLVLIAMSMSDYVSRAWGSF